ncbi:MAG: YggS family pyridoxal phosphate-dependent enzyme [Alphaproteobacteria bacterium]|nr:YggS family pyridoxal phosphate-dependent enzyme [Alphaproteobacteria bacterium]
MNTATALSTIRDEITTLTKQAGRESHAVRLIAVSKTRSTAEIENIIMQGQRDFGENRVQEAQQKWPGLIEKYPDVRLRLIGPLQTNKVKYLPGLFRAVDSVDRLSLAKALARQAERGDYHPECLVQVNTGEEEQKAGIAPRAVSAFLANCENLGLDVRGLMCIPPITEAASIHFALLKKIADDHGLPECSMGMSSDYPQAINLGATIVRIGTALFGACS